MLRSQAEAAATPPSGPAHRNTARAAKPPNRERARASATELMPRTIAVRAAAKGKACRRPPAVVFRGAGAGRERPASAASRCGLGMVSSQPAAVAGTAEQRAGGLNPVPCVWNTEKHQSIHQPVRLLVNNRKFPARNSVFFSHQTRQQ